jgi:hypothetical protein
VAHSWRTQRWDSVRLLTPNWMTRLAGHAYTCDDPHGCLGMGRLLDTLDAWADRAGVDAGPPERFAPTTVPAPVLTMPLTGVGAVVWATGFRPELSFLSDTGVLDRQGRVVHNGGVTERPRPGST